MEESSVKPLTPCPVDEHGRGAVQEVAGGHLFDAGTHEGLGVELPVVLTVGAAIDGEDGSDAYAYINV